MQNGGTYWRSSLALANRRLGGQIIRELARSGIVLPSDGPLEGVSPTGRAGRVLGRVGAWFGYPRTTPAVRSEPKYHIVLLLSFYRVPGQQSRILQ